MQAAHAYAAILATSPGNEAVAVRAYNQAVVAGDRDLALDAARLLDQSSTLPADGRLLLLDEAVRTKKWKIADRQIEALGKDEIFSFLAPILRGWVAQASHNGDPLTLMAAGTADPLGASYVAEQRPLLLLALGHEEQGAIELVHVAGGGLHGERLRIAAAAALTREHKRDAALAVLAGNTPSLIAARAIVAKGGQLSNGNVTVRGGIAELMLRIAVDLQQQDVKELALRYARLATFAAPENSEGWIMASMLLDDADSHQAALALLANIAPDDPFATTARDARAKLLVDSGQQDAAVAEASKAANAAGAGISDWTRLGDLFTQLGRHGEAADAYGRAIALGAQDKTLKPDWTLWLLRGSALVDEGKWPEAKAALEQAYKLAPEQPVVLNYLGYSQLERHENLEEATRLIAEANRLNPGDPAISDSLGWAYYLGGNLKGAIEMLERAAQGDPSDASIWEHLGDAYYSAGRRYEARYTWKAALGYASAEDAPRLRDKIETGLKPKLASP